MDKEMLEKINKFTRRPFTEDEIYVFSVILCDNDIDRDGERFSDKALDKIAELFVGKTGIFDHNPSSSEQTARIFEAEVISDDSRRTKTGEIYKCVRADAYMVRTDENRSLIAEIDGGIKKEVSVSCSAAKRSCSVCGNVSCSHVSGREYNGKMAYRILDDITDAYEWSFVAVPAQVGAGVTKKFSSDSVESVPVEGDIAHAQDELRRDIRRLAFFNGGHSTADITSVAARTMNTSQLISLKKFLEKKCFGRGVIVQLEPENNISGSTSEFSLR